MRTFAQISLSLVAVAGLAGIATAGDPAPKPTPTSKTPAPAPTADKKAPPPTTPTSPPRAEKPKPPPELATAMKAMGGTWRCTGTATDPVANKDMPTKGTIKTKLDLDNWWLTSTFAEGKKGGFKFTSYETYDGKTLKWTRVMVDNMGNRETAESSGLKDKKMVWEGQSAGAMGTMKSRHTVDVVSAKEVKILGEWSQDGAKWNKGYEVDCKK